MRSLHYLRPALFGLALIGALPGAQADDDKHVVRTDNGRFVEVQGTGEKTPFSPQEMQVMLELAAHGTNLHFDCQRKALRDILPALLPRP